MYTLTTLQNILIIKLISRILLIDHSSTKSKMKTKLWGRPRLGINERIS